MKNGTYGPAPVLVIARALRPKIRQAIREHGLRAVEASTLTETMARLRSGTFTAIVIDPRNAVLDPLEMVLNVRDFNTEMPIILLHRNGDGRVPAPLLAQPAFSLVPVGELDLALQRLAQHDLTAETETA